MPLFDEILGNIRSERAKKKRFIVMGVAGEGPEMKLIASAFSKSESVSGLVYYHPDARKAERYAAEIGARAVSDENEFVSGVGAYAIWLMAYLASVEAYHAQA